jgi:hypothetical protein
MLVIPNSEWYPAYFSHSTVTLSTLLTNVDIQRSIRDTPIDIRF